MGKTSIWSPPRDNNEEDSIRICSGRQLIWKTTTCLAVGEDSDEDSTPICFASQPIWKTPTYLPLRKDADEGATIMCPVSQPFGSPCIRKYIMPGSTTVVYIVPDVPESIHEAVYMKSDSLLEKAGMVPDSLPLPVKKQPNSVVQVEKQPNSTLQVEKELNSEAMKFMWTPEQTFHIILFGTGVIKLFFLKFNINMVSI